MVVRSKARQGKRRGLERTAESSSDRLLSRESTDRCRRCAAHPPWTGSRIVGRSGAAAPRGWGGTCGMSPGCCSCAPESWECLQQQVTNDKLLLARSRIMSATTGNKWQAVVCTLQNLQNVCNKRQQMSSHSCADNNIHHAITSWSPNKIQSVLHCTVSYFYVSSTGGRWGFSQWRASRGGNPCWPWRSGWRRVTMLPSRLLRCTPEGWKQRHLYMLRMSARAGDCQEAVSMKV